MTGTGSQWSSSRHCTAVTPALPDPSSSYLAEIWSFIFSIFLENFDHWLPRLTNESADRVTCVAPPAPTPPATRQSWRKFAQLWTVGDPGWLGDRPGPPGLRERQGPGRAGDPQHP